MNLEEFRAEEMLEEVGSAVLPLRYPEQQIASVPGQHLIFCFYEADV